jgi:hypothetical protein
LFMWPPPHDNMYMYMSVRARACEREGGRETERESDCI